MSNKTALFAIAVVTYFGTTCFAQHSAPVLVGNGSGLIVANTSSTPEENSLADAERKFSVKLFLELSKTSNDKNLAISPFGVFECLYFLHEFTKDQAKSEIANALGISIDVSRLQEVESAYKPVGPEQTYTIYNGTQATTIRHELQTNKFIVVINGGFAVNTYRSD